LGNYQNHYAFTDSAEEPKVVMSRDIIQEIIKGELVS
jgi:hypothetical protein